MKKSTQITSNENYYSTRLSFSEIPKKIMHTIMLAFFSLSFLVPTIQGQDVAICGLDGSGSASGAGDEFSFVLLRDFAAGEIIYFTEDEYSDFANAFNSGEGHLSYTVPAGGLLENDVVRIRETGANVFTVECATGTATFVAGSGTWSFSSSDELYAYSASSAVTPWSTVTEIHVFITVQLLFHPLIKFLLQTIQMQLY